jgi:hypothetical protein
VLFCSVWRRGFSGGCGGSARIQRFLCGLDVVVKSFGWTGDGSWRFGVAVVVLEDLSLGLCFSQQGLVLLLCCVMLLLF